MNRYPVDINNLFVIPRGRVSGDYPIGHDTHVEGGKPVRVGLNPQGAVYTIEKNLGLKPEEFDFVCPFCEGKTELVGYGGRMMWTITASRDVWRFDRVIITREFTDDKPELAWYWRVYERAVTVPAPLDQEQKVLDDEGLAKALESLPRPTRRRTPHQLESYVQKIVCKYGGSR